MGKHKRAGKGPDKGTPSTDKGKSKYRDIPKPEDVNTEFAGGATAKLIRDHYLHRAIDECECGHRGDIDEWAAHLASLLEGRQKESLNASWRNSLVRVWCVAHQEIEEVYRPVQGPIQGIVEDWHGKTRTGRE
jgi:hypothetical protein